jgi:Fe-S cluster biogenesis protein NfuA
MVSRKPTRKPTTTPRAAVHDAVAKVIATLRPMIQGDGGDVELVEVTEDGVVKVRLKGACIGCPSSTMTLSLGIERNVRDAVPEVTRVELV